MNPFTHSLVQQLDDPAIHAFVRQWDALEAFIIEVFRNKSATARDEQFYQTLRQELRELYTQWQEALEPFWRRTKIRGKQRGEFTTPKEDPFLQLLHFEHAEDFAKNRTTFITLPATREALNAFLLSKIPAT